MNAGELACDALTRTRHPDEVELLGGIVRRAGWYANPDRKFRAQYNFAPVSLPNQMGIDIEAEIAAAIVQEISAEQGWRLWEAGTDSQKAIYEARTTDEVAELADNLGQDSLIIGEPNTLLRMVPRARRYKKQYAERMACGLRRWGGLRQHTLWAFLYGVGSPHILICQKGWFESRYDRGFWTVRETDPNTLAPTNTFHTDQETNIDLDRVVSVKMVHG